MKITVKLLKQLHACNEAIELFESAQLDGIDLDTLLKVKLAPKYKWYIEWLKSRKFDTFVFDKNGNLIRYTDFNNYVNFLEYDENYNLTRFESTCGYYYIKKYDKNNNVIMFKSSTNYWYNQEFNEHNNLIRYENSDNYVISDLIRCKTPKRNYLCIQKFDKYNNLIYERKYNKKGRLLWLKENNIIVDFRPLYNSIKRKESKNENYS